MDVAELSMFLDTLGMGKGTQSDLEFENAANSVKNMKDIDDVQRLQLYGLYRQGTVGDINCNVPSALALQNGSSTFTYIPDALRYILCCNLPSVKRRQIIL